MTFLSSANIMGSNKACIVAGRLFIYNVKRKDPRFDFWQTPFFIAPQSEKKF
jgi:hypothetical protein